jgi:hypothetical protein
LFVDYHYGKDDGRWSGTYQGKVLRIKAYFIDGDESNAVFATSFDDCMKPGYRNIEDLEKAKKTGSESPFGYAIYVAKKKEVNTNTFGRGQLVIIDIVIDKMQGESRLIAQCSNATSAD